LIIDQEFFIKKGPLKLKRPRGRPKKKKLFYFESEAEFYTKKLSITVNSLDRKRYFTLLITKKYLFIKFLLTFSLGLKKPF